MIVVLYVLLAIAFISIGVWVALERGFGIPSPFRLAEMHHFYLALPLVLGGLLWAPLGWLGLAVAVDDLWQHAHQTFGDQEYQSPLHRLYGLAWARWAWVREVGWWLDGLFS